ncbi:hypothetical protein MNBD_DELTA04-1285 [hydrothermal vent metagenome]|uniref:SHSP domain-containing protein n=1 Tax=hydrothermal vent metagenome TaxID=652676 RepID=A0A3B0UTW5_9ZZZZ
MSERMNIVTREENSPELTRQGVVITPLVDIFENDEEILLFADLPGVRQENLSVNLENNSLTIAGSRTLETRNQAVFEEFGDAEYRRVFSMPQGIDTETVKAELKDGVLRLHLPKSEALKPRQIEVKAG